MVTNVARGAGRQASSRASLRRLVVLLERWMELRRERRRLLELSDAMLRDLGLTRADAEHEGSRWFWDLPQHRR